MNKRLDIINVDRNRGVAYVAFYSSDKPNEEECTNMELPLTKLESLLGYKLNDGQYNDYLIVSVDWGSGGLDDYWN